MLELWLFDSLKFFLLVINSTILPIISHVVPALAWISLDFVWILVKCGSKSCVGLVALSIAWVLLLCGSNSLMQIVSLLSSTSCGFVLVWF